MSLTFWQPRVLRHRLPDGSAEYAIHEVYFTKDGSVVTCTEDALSDRRSSVADMESWIRLVLSEGKVEIVCGDLGYTYDEENLGHWLLHVHEPPIDYDRVGEEAEQRE